MQGGSDLIQILRKNHNKKRGGLKVLDKVSNDVIAVIEKIGNKKQKFISNSLESKIKDMIINPSQMVMYPHIPVGKERFIVFISGEGGMGKSSLTSLMMKQANKLIKKLRVFYICGTSVGADRNISALKFVETLDGDLLKDINVERDLENSLLVFDDIDNWEYHKDAIKILNKAYECGRKFGINIIYISHNTTKAQESRIYDEVDMYITNKSKNNRMFEHYLRLDQNIIEEMDHYLKEDVFVCYNKMFHCIYTDKRIYRLD